MVTKNDVESNETTQPVEETTTTTSNESNKENSPRESLPAKYLVLANAILWKDPDSDFMLTWTDQTVEHTLRDPAYGTDVKQPKTKIKEGNWWVSTSDIPKDTRLYTLINRAVKAGTLVFVDSPEKWLNNIRKAKANSNGRVGLIWNELENNEVKANKSYPVILVLPMELCPTKIKTLRRTNYCRKLHKN